jgi:flagellar protein FlaG
MENKLALIPPAIGTGAAASPAPPSPASNTVAMRDDAADLRLVIEEDKPTGTFIYKTVDRRTGEVVQQLPREEVIRLRDAVAYAIGSIIRAKA